MSAGPTTASERRRASVGSTTGVGGPVTPMNRGPFSLYGFRTSGAPEPLSAPESDEPPAGAGPAAPRVWTVFALFGASVLALLVGQFALATIVVLVTGDAREAFARLSTPGGFLATALLFEALLAAAAVGAAVLSPVAWRERLHLQAGRLSCLGTFAAVAGALAVSQGFESLMALGVVPRSPALEGLGELIGALSGWSIAGGVLVIGIAPGIAEELMFRGYVQTRLVERWGAAPGILTASLLFGILHVDPVHAAFAFGIGVFLGYLTLWTGSIRAAIVCHAANNTASTLTTVWGFEIAGRKANLAACAASAIVLGLALSYLRRFRGGASRGESAGSREADGFED